MPNINYQGNGGGVPRKTAKIFANSASTQDMTVFGSTLANNTQYATDLDSLQSSHYEVGWREAIISNLNYPLLSDMNAVQHTVTQQIAYTLQHGVPEWNSATTYYTYDIVNQGGILYISIVDNQTNHQVTDTDYWAEYYNPSWFSQYQIGQIVSSLIPLANAGLHLLDGTLLSADGIYGEFVNYMATLVSTAPDCFTTESAWQQSISDYGVCGRFVYTAPAGQNPATVRLPKITGVLEGTIDVNALGDLVEAGLPNITGKVDGNVSNTGSYDNGLEAFGECNQNNTNTTGAFSPLWAMQAQVSGITGTGAVRLKGFEFDASDSNGIYGNSSTVQPQTIKCFYYICVATSAKTDIEVNINKIATDLNNKADKATTLAGYNITDGMNTNASNATATAMATITSWGVPDYDNATTITWNTTYQADKDGIVIFECQDITTGKVVIKIGKTSSTLETVSGWGSDMSTNTFSYTGLAIVPKGYYYRLYADSIESWGWHKFIPLKGAS